MKKKRWTAEGNRADLVIVFRQLLFDTQGGTTEMRVGGAGTRWQDIKQSEKQQQSEAYGLRADNPRTSRLTAEPPALSVAGPFFPLSPLQTMFYKCSSLIHARASLAHFAHAYRPPLRLVIFVKLSNASWFSMETRDWTNQLSWQGEVQKKSSQSRNIVT